MAFCAVLIVIWASLSFARGDSGNSSGVMLIPGIAGTALRARYSKTSALPGCVKEDATTDWFPLWMSWYYFSPPRSRQQCWFDTMTLTQHPNTKPAFLPRPVKGQADLGTWTSADGVIIEPVDGLNGVDYLSHLGSLPLPVTRYFHNLIFALTAAGLAPNNNLAAFPYDWRLPPWQLEWDKFKRSVEQLREQTGKPAVIVAHSMGVLHFNYFLRAVVDSEWKAQNVRALISISGAIGGSFKAIRTLISGYNPAEISWLHYLNLPEMVLGSGIRAMARTFVSMFLLLPSEELYVSDTPVATVISKSGEPVELALSNWTSVLPTPLRNVILGVRKLVGETVLQDPGVPVYCIYSKSRVGPSTDRHYLYGDESLDREPLVSLGEGDGTLPEQSLRFCHMWRSTVLEKEFDNLDHLEILRSAEVVKFVTDLIEVLT